MQSKCFLLFVFLGVLLLAPARAEVIISEIGPSNHCIYFDENGDTPDWVELLNDGEAELSLDGWMLSDDAFASRGLALDGVTLAAGEYRLVPLGPDAGFGLSASGETLYLLHDGVAAAEAAFPALPQDVSWALFEDGYAATWLPTPGMSNCFLGEEEVFVPEDGPRFNEILTSAAPYKSNKGYDYVELINTGRRVNLAGWELQLGMAGSKTCKLGKKQLDPNDLAAFCCTDKTIKNANTGFALPAQGAILSLWNPDGELADFIRLPRQYANVSYGLSRDRSVMGYLSKSSFGSRNAAAYSARADAPALSPAGGVYPGESVTVTISGPEDAVIRYTTDGSAPTQKSKVYTEPLTLKSTTALRAAAFRDGMLQSEDVSATYVLGLDAQFPVICLIIDPQYLTDPNDGVITGKTDGVRNWRFHWEYPARFEYFDADGQCLLNQACGFGVQGDSSRASKQKGFQLIARKSYGTSGTFGFNPFDDRDFAEYKSFNLRAAGSEGEADPRFRDAALSSLAEGTSLLYAAAKPALVYLNGKVYGHYNLRERINKYCIAQHEGITDSDTIDAIDILSETGDWVRNGSGKDYAALSSFMKNHDLRKPENLEYVLSQMDVQSYFEYVAFMMATGNRDLSNSRFYRVPGGKWKWALYDLDRAMEQADHYAAFWLYTLSPSHQLELYTDHVPFVTLMRVPAMREQFLSTLSEIMLSRFMPDKLTALIDQWHDLLAPIMPFQLSRWSKESMYYWESKVDSLRRFASQRPKWVIKYTVSYFNLTKEEKERYFGALTEALP